MRVIDWIGGEESNHREVSVGGMGGFFQNGMRWDAYIKSFLETFHPYLEAIREDVVKNGIEICGDEHQNSDRGVPLFENGTIGSFSFRAWGDLMAAIWSTERDQDYSYLDFYMSGWSQPSHDIGKQEKSTDGRRSTSQ